MTITRFADLQSLRGYSILFRRENYWPMIFVSSFFVLFLGFRPISMAFVDTVNYNLQYQNLQTLGIGITELPEDYTNDWLFYGFMALCAQFIDVYGFLAIIMCLYVAMMFVGCRKLDSRHGATLMLFCIGAFSFYSYAVNGIRNGVACSFVVLAIASVCKGEKIWPIILSFIAINCHKSTALPLASMFFTYFVRNPKWMYIIWGGALILSLAFGDIIGEIISLIGYDERLASNIGDATGDEGEVLEKSGFRWDFLIYGIVPMVMGWYVLFVRKVYNNTYLILLGTYIYANSFWLLVNRTYFSNRYAYLSWFIYPIVLAYPLFNLPVFEKDHSQKTAWILLGHLSFTVVMWMLGKQ